MVTVVFNEQRNMVWRALNHVFEAESGIEIVQEDLDAFLHRPDLDAQLLNRPLVHENYVRQMSLTKRTSAAGHRHLVSSAPVYRTWPARYPDVTSAPWAVAEPVFSPDLKPGELAFEEIMYLKFKQIFEAVEGLNATGEEPKIRRLGSYLEFIYKVAAGVTDADVESSIQAIRRAYHEHREREAGG